MDNIFLESASCPHCGTTVRFDSSEPQFGRCGGCARVWYVNTFGLLEQCGDKNLMITVSGCGFGECWKTCTRRD